MKTCGCTKHLPIVAQADGPGLGLAEGEVDGLALTLGLGLVEDNALGDLVGEADGLEVGFFDGDPLGRSLGEADMDGTPDGEVEGVRDKLWLSNSHSSMLTNLNFVQSMGPVKEGLPTA